MASLEQLSILRKGHIIWNEWRTKNPGVQIDLSFANLEGIDFSLMPALEILVKKGEIPPGSSWSFIANEIIGYKVAPLNLSNANFMGSSFLEADLRSANCAGANFNGAKLINTNLGRANLVACQFIQSDLSNSNLRGSNLSKSIFIETLMQNVDIAYSKVYGVSVWDISGEIKDETSLNVSKEGETALIIDNLAMAQFMNFIRDNKNLSGSIDTLTLKTVLILGNFSESRKVILGEIKKRIRALGFLPVLYDFTGPQSKDVTGTVEFISRMSRFIVADITDPRSIPHELATTVPFLRTTPIVLIQERESKGYSMVSDMLSYPWVLEPHKYTNIESLVNSLPEIIKPAVVMSEKFRL